MKVLWVNGAKGFLKPSKAAKNMPEIFIHLKLLPLFEK